MHVYALGIIVYALGVIVLSLCHFVRCQPIPLSAQGRQNNNHWTRPSEESQVYNFLSSVMTQWMELSLASRKAQEPQVVITTTTQTPIPDIPVANESNSRWWRLISGIARVMVGSSPPLKSASPEARTECNCKRDDSWKPETDNTDLALVESEVSSDPLKGRQDLATETTEPSSTSPIRNNSSLSQLAVNAFLLLISDVVNSQSKSTSGRAVEPNTPLIVGINDTSTIAPPRSSYFFW